MGSRLSETDQLSEPGIISSINSDWAQNQLAKLRSRRLGYLGKRRKECQETQVLQINQPGARGVKSFR